MPTKVSLLLSWASGWKSLLSWKAPHLMVRSSLRRVDFAPNSTRVVLCPVGQAPGVWGSIFFFSGRGRRPAIPQHPNHLQVIIDIRYQYAIIVVVGRHDSLVPCEIGRAH